ncbi:hypothetical protein PpBr36_00094 [Pyricularia pennisetigena]|uniref:hypothetical protein n=1 Tax=Pyricularia pennisetigena TaxID=1578925 RepID=UPI0011547915|nr:hypothetical protein PpBr36_00094 [Pyricularia pennisetigena]TLS27990.1 hypothetical protein PpBr36_00094 [Pyricularia pennisetigena]
MVGLARCRSRLVRCRSRLVLGRSCSSSNLPSRCWKNGALEVGRLLSETGPELWDNDRFRSVFDDGVPPTGCDPKARLKRPVPDAAGISAVTGLDDPTMPCSLLSESLFRAPGGPGIATPLG